MLPHAFVDFFFVTKEIQQVAIQQKLEEFAMPHLDFVEMQVVVGTSDHDPALVDDDLTREFALYVAPAGSGALSM